MARPKNPRPPAFGDEIMRKEHARQRRELVSQEARRAAETLNEARQALRGVHPTTSRDHELALRRNSVITGLLPRVKAVMGSYGFRLPVFAEASESAGGWTDFKSIHMQYDRRLVEATLDSIVDSSSLRMLAGETRGVFYHELGHNR